MDRSTLSLPGMPVDLEPLEREFREELTDSFVQHKIKISVARLRRYLTGYERYEEVFDDERVDWCDRIRMTRVAWRIAKLWNYTPRPDLAGRRPAELFLEQSQQPQSAQVADAEIRFVRLPGMLPLGGKDPG